MTMGDDKQFSSVQAWIAVVSLGVAVVVAVGTGVWLHEAKSTELLGYTPGSAAAVVFVLLLSALVLRFPRLIMDGNAAEGGEASTMRIAVLAIITTFCALLLRTGWHDGALPSLENQGNWVWLLTAAFGGKALQKYAEVRDNKPPAGGPKPPDKPADKPADKPPG
jgi:hypothetical protein